MIQVLSAVCALLCVIEAAPGHEWHWTNPYSAQRTELNMKDDLNVARAAQSTRSSNSQCSSAVSSLETEEFEHYVHVCNDKQGVCYYSIGAPCCSNTGIPMSSDSLTVGGRVLNVRHFLTEDDSLCYTVPDDLGSCTSKRECTPACSPPRNPCVENTVTESIESCAQGTCQCKPGWAPPDCCKCAADHFLLNGQCIPLCRENCEIPDQRGGQCFQCRVGWAPPDCCQCDSGYYMADDGSCQRICTESALECTVEGCTECKPGYTGPDCCECDSGYYRAPDGTCKPICVENALECTADGCTQCKPGYTGPDCCDCDSNYYRAPNGTCKPICTESALECTIDGCTQCNPGYTGPDCCECDSGYYRASDGTCKAPCETGVSSCSDGVCVCKLGYVGEGCCDCDTNYYRASNGTCQSPCLENTASCSNESCTCNEGFIGDDCCEVKPTSPPCSSIQDVYFVVDTTFSNDAIPFCETLYSVQLITAELNPGIIPVATRIGAYVYPQNMQPEDEDVRLVDVGQFQCPLVTRKFHDLVLQLSFAKNKGLADKVNARGTYPDPVLDVLAKDIRREIEEGIVPRSRRRVIVVLTDGNSDSSDQAIRASVQNLMSIAPDDMTLIVAGLATSYVITDLNAFTRHLTIIANGNSNNVVAERDAAKLSFGLVDKMRENGAICGQRAQRVIDALNRNQSNAYCWCRSEFLYGSFYTPLCNQHCTAPRTHRDCRFPPPCNVASANLESEIMAAAEEVLLERDEEK